MGILFAYNGERYLMNKLLELREAAKACSNVYYRAMLNNTADRLQECIEQLHTDATADNMVALNGAWIRAVMALANMPPEAQPTPPQSQAEELKMAA